MGFIDAVICCISRYNLLFSLTGGGKYNFLGTKKWIEENLDHAGKSLTLFPAYKTDPRAQRLYSLCTVVRPLMRCSCTKLQCVKHMLGKLHLQSII